MTPKKKKPTAKKAESRAESKAGSKAARGSAATKGTTKAGSTPGSTPARARPAGRTATGARAGKPAAKRPAAATAPKRRAQPAAAASGATPERAAADAKRLKAARSAAEAAIDAALDKKALVPILLDVSEEGTYTDFIGIVSGRSDRQVDAIAENVTMTMKQRGWPLVGREGAGNGRWTLLDFGDFVLHVFHHPVREFYDIEGLWIEAPRVDLKVPPEAMHVQPDALYENV